MARLGVLVLLTSTLASSALGDGGLEPERVAWQELHYRASKFFITADASVALSRVEGDEVLIELESELLGRRSTTRLWLDATTAAALREERRKVHDEADLRTYSYQADHALKVRYHERPSAEGDQPISTWREKSRERQDYLAHTEAKTVPPAVTTPSALLYLLAASPLRAPGDVVETPIFADERLVTARAEAVELVSFDRELELSQAGAADSVYVPKRALKLRLTGRDPAGGPVDLGLLGLEGDLEIVLDVDKRLPLSIKGSMPVVGQLTVRLRAARLGG